MKVVRNRTGEGADKVTCGACKSELEIGADDLVDTRVMDGWSETKAATCYTCPCCGSLQSYKGSLRAMWKDVTKDGVTERVSKYPKHPPCPNTQNMRTGQCFNPDCVCKEDA